MFFSIFISFLLITKSVKIETYRNTKENELGSQVDFQHKKLGVSFHFLTFLSFTSMKESLQWSFIKCLLSVKSDIIVTSKVTNHPGLPETFPVFALKVLSPEKPLCSRQSGRSSIVLCWITCICSPPLSLKELMVSSDMRKQCM